MWPPEEVCEEEYNCTRPAASGTVITSIQSRSRASAASVEGYVIGRNASGVEMGRCNFTVGNVVFNAVGRAGSGVPRFELQERTGFAFDESDCIFDDSTFLPNQLFFNSTYGMFTEPTSNLFYAFDGSADSTSAFNDYSDYIGNPSCSYLVNYTSFSASFIGDLQQGDVLIRARD